MPNAAVITANLFDCLLCVNITLKYNIALHNTIPFITYHINLALEIPCAILLVDVDI